jgi:hypothetical protein
MCPKDLSPSLSQKHESKRARAVGEWAAGGFFAALQDRLYSGLSLFPTGLR